MDDLIKDLGVEESKNLSLDLYSSYSESILGDSNPVVYVDLEYLTKVFFKMLDIKESIYSIGLKEGFVKTRNLHDRDFYGVLSDYANLLIGSKFTDKLKDELNGLKDELKDELNGLNGKCIKARKVLLERCLENEKVLYEEYNRSVLKDPLNKLMYYNQLLDLVTLYLYVVSLYMSEMVELSEIK